MFQLLLLTATACALGPLSLAQPVEPGWSRALRLARRVLAECRSKARRVTAAEGADPWEGTRLCLKIRALRSLDQALQQDVVPLGRGLELVRLNSTAGSSRSMRPEKVLEEGVADLVLERLSEALDTHVLRFRDDDRDDDQQAPGADRESGKGRIRRRHYRHMFPLMVVGFMTMASFLVPLGFQFMAMLGGKALLLSKIALMMSTFQGIKKVTSAGYNYGFYHAPPSVELYHSHAAHHPEVWRRTAVVPEAGKSYHHGAGHRCRYSAAQSAQASSQPADEGAAAQLQAYQRLMALLPTQQARGPEQGGVGGAGDGQDGYQGSVGQPLPFTSDQHVLAVIPYLQNVHR